MWPITFNGMLFNANRANNSGTGECIDARTWGEMAFWQNTRLPYHSMVRAGDADRLETIFRYYNNMVPCDKKESFAHLFLLAAFRSK